MKEAIGTSMVFNLMMIFLGIMIAIVIGAVSYSKGFKVRNRIIDRIEEFKGYDNTSGSEVREAIEKDLKDIGYQIKAGTNECPNRDKGSLLTDETSSELYRYCIYEYNTSKGNYYGVTVFISVDIPLIGKYINVPVYGETRIIFNKEGVSG